MHVHGPLLDIHLLTPDLIDELDARILDLIQQDAGLSVAEIAERVGLSSSPCWRRIKRLEDAGKKPADQVSNRTTARSFTG